MSTHILVIDLDSIEQAKLDAGEYVLPEHPDSHHHWIKCIDPAHCNGWMECFRLHICPHGHDAHAGFDEPCDDGACPGHDPDSDLPNCFSGDDEFTFHGEHHTWRYGYGWTVKWPGCVVADNDWDVDVRLDRLPRGEYEVQDDWDDTSCYLILTDPAMADA